MSDTIHCNIDELIEQLDEMQNALSKDAVDRCLMKGAELLKDATVQSFLRKNNTPGLRRIITENPKAVGVRSNKWISEVIVSITNKDDWRLHFFENGTVERYFLRKGTGNRGYKNSGKHYFRHDTSGKAVKNSSGSYEKIVKKDVTQGAYRGKIEGTNFFADARQSSADKVLQAIIDAFADEMKLE